MANSWHALVEVLVADHPVVPSKRTAGAFPSRLVLAASATLAVAVWAYLDTFHHRWPLPEQLLLVLLVGLTVLSVGYTYRRPLRAWRLAIVLYAVSPVVFSRPPLVGYFRDAWSLGSPWLDVVVVVTLYLVAERERPAALVWVGLLTVLATASQRFHGAMALSAFVVIVGALLAGSTSRLRSRAREEQLRQADERAARSALEERARIARELHDVVAHHMSVLTLRADSAPYRLPDLTDEVRAEFAALCTTARDGLIEMRRLLGVLRAEDETMATSPQPTLAQIDDLVAQLRAAGTSVSLSLETEPGSLHAGLALSAYRIVQEALSNATQHSPGAEVRVDLRTGDGMLHIAVRNSPCAHTPDLDYERPRLGLLGMRERVDTLGGRLHAGPTAEGGFAVTATLPLDDVVGGNR